MTHINIRRDNSLDCRAPGWRLVLVDEDMDTEVELRGFYETWQDARNAQIAAAADFGTYRELRP